LIPLTAIEGTQINSGFKKPGSQALPSPILVPE